MAYAPILIIRKSDIDKHKEALENQLWNGNEEELAKYLLRISETADAIFDDIEIVCCEPEPNSFNRLVRQKLDELNIKYFETT